MRKLIGATVVAALVVIFLLVLSSSRPTSRFANGTEVSLLAVTHGPSNIFIPGNLLERLVYKFGPSNGISFRSFRIAPVSPLIDYWQKADGTASFPNRAVVWLGHRGPANAPALPVPKAKWHSDIRATLADETGEEWETRTGVAHLRPSVGNGLNWISSWDFSSFPRRGKSLRLRLYARKGTEQWDTLVDFNFPNPDRGPHPTWAPSKLPAARTNADLEVSLVELVSGMEPVPYNLGVRQFTRAMFEVREHGQPTEVWLPDRMEATDATGNEPLVPMVNYWASNRLVNYEIQCVSLSPSETWLMRMRFCNEKDPNARPIWTSPELPVLNGLIKWMNLTTNVAASTITLECNQTSSPNTVRLKVDPLPKDTRLRHAEIFDDQGRPAVFESGGFDDSGFDARWKIPAGAKWLKVSIGLVETRTFEFLARPTAVARGVP